MPLYKSFKINENTHLLVWRITESFNELFRQVKLKDVCLARLEGMKSELHQRGFLSVRMLLQEAGYTDFDLYYDENGKPHLKDGKIISITHSYSFSAIVISNKNIGIDMELRREKIAKIADKFICNEFNYLSPEKTADYIKKLTIIWGVKEALFKMISKSGLSFKQNMEVFSFEIIDKKGKASVHFEKIIYTYPFFFEEIENFTLVYTLEE